MAEIPEDVMQTAKAMLATIDTTEVYVSEGDNMRSMVIDGCVDVIAMAQAAIAAERERCAKMCEDAGFDDHGLCAKLIRGEIAI